MNKSDLFKLLLKQNIKFETHEHDPLYTVDDSIKLRGKIEGAHTKNLFLKNKKSDFFLFSCLEDRAINLKLLKKNLNIGNISFASENHLKKLLGVLPGSVTPFGLLNDIDNEVSFYLDKELIDHEILNFHPLTNTATISINTCDFLKFMHNNKRLVKIINFDTYTIQ